MRVGTLGCLAVCVACETPPYPKPEITGVDPHIWPHQPAATTRVIVEGYRFHYGLPVDRTRPDMRFRARIGSVAITDVDWIDNHQLQVNVPGSIPPDTYDITVRTPTGGWSNAVEVTIMEPDGWWNEGWQWRNWITADNSTRDEDLVNFPVLVVFDGTFPYARADLDGADLRFVGQNFHLLAYEIERWNPGGESFIWVRLPEIRANSTTTFWHYFGNPSAGDDTSANAVWSADYAGVWHLNQIAHPYRDSTSHGINATVSGDVATSPSGFIGDGANFDGPTEALLTFADPPRAANEPFTLELWLNLDRPHTGHWIGLLVKGRTSHDSWHGLYVQPGTILTGGWASGSQGGNLGGTALSTGVWTHAALTFDGTNAVLYRDGDVEHPASPRWYNEIQQQTVAGSDLNGNPYLDGRLDEIRFSAIARSPAWLDAQHASMAGAMLTYGPIEPQP